MRTLVSTRGEGPGTTVAYHDDRKVNLFSKFFFVFRDGFNALNQIGMIGVNVHHHEGTRSRFFGNGSQQHTRKATSIRHDHHIPVNLLRVVQWLELHVLDIGLDFSIIALGFAKNVPVDRRGQDGGGFDFKKGAPTRLGSKGSDTCIDRRNHGRVTPFNHCRLLRMTPRVHIVLHSFQIFRSLHCHKQQCQCHPHPTQSTRHSVRSFLSTYNWIFTPQTKLYARP
mmetsp:Transcript_17963/g.32560  ORF Transcript_17963/g.32560 Transcript_17963/m.32560 type:complete len:225 (-) Transcript_17963:97-771(-)